MPASSASSSKCKKCCYKAVMVILFLQPFCWLVFLMIQQKEVEQHQHHGYNAAAASRHEYKILKKSNEWKVSQNYTASISLLNESIQSNTSNNQIEENKNMNKQPSFTKNDNYHGGYVMDFSQYRANPIFRQIDSEHVLNLSANKVWRELENKVSKQFGLENNKTRMKSCQYYNLSNLPLPHLSFVESCDDASSPGQPLYYVYNQLPFARTWCGVTIPPKSTSIINHACQNDDDDNDAIVHLFPTTNSNEPSLFLPHDLSKLPTIRFKRIESKADFELITDCPVSCEFTMDTCRNNKKGIDCLPALSTWTVNDTPFVFTFTLHPPSRFPSTAFDAKAYRTNHYIASRSFQSEIPLSLLNWTEFATMSPQAPKEFEKVLKRLVFIQPRNQCGGTVRAGIWAEALEQSLGGALDSFGACLHNKQPVSGTNLDKLDHRMQIFHQYMFTLVIESSMDDDHILPILWEALYAGSIPVYIGAPNVLEHVPPNSIIHAASHGNNKKQVGNHLINVKSNKVAWSKYHSWRQQRQQSEQWKERYQFLKSSPYCRMCQWAHAKRFGLRWNHKTQSISPRNNDKEIFCQSSNGQITGAVREIWITSTYSSFPNDYDENDNNNPQSTSGLNSCLPIKSKVTKIAIGSNASVVRSIVEHNGILDMIISKINYEESLTLQVQFPHVNNKNQAHFPNVHQLLSNDSPDVVPFISSIAIQDETTKATILTNWITSFSIETKLEKGCINIDFPKNDLQPYLKLRIILEPMDPLRDVDTEYWFSFFARVRALHFMEPLQYFDTVTD